MLIIIAWMRVLSERRYRDQANQSGLQDSMDRGPRIGDAVLSGRYSLLAQAKGPIGGGTVFLGAAGQCRYCGETEPARFRMVAHAFPEALGNKWVISRDECDGCNQILSKYDDAIARAVSPFLTLGGVKGKSNKVRQTGRSEGDAVISRRFQFAAQWSHILKCCLPLSIFLIYSTYRCVQLIL